MMQLANIVNDDEGAVLNLLHGTRLEILIPSNEDAYWVMKGTIPPGGACRCTAIQTPRVSTGSLEKAKSWGRPRWDWSGRSSGQETSSMFLAERSMPGAIVRVSRFRFSLHVLRDSAAHFGRWHKCRLLRTPSNASQKYHSVMDTGSVAPRKMHPLELCCVDARLPFPENKPITLIVVDAIARE